MNAAGFGHISCVSELTKNGALLDLRDDDGWTAISWASTNGQHHVVKLLATLGSDAGAHDLYPVWRRRLGCVASGSERAVVLLALHDLSPRASGLCVRPHIGI